MANGVPDPNDASGAIWFPPKLRFLFAPKRYKVAYGGRGGAKSWGFARALLILGTQRPLRVLCARELQTSIKESVHQLLAQQIVNLGLTHCYEVQNATIKGFGPAEGTEFFFEGLKHNAAKIKSYEGIDVAWVEEAQKITSTSWNILIPTIRKAGSEIWVSFNPELETDATYQRFVAHAPDPATHQVVFMSWRDNPWFPEVSKADLEALKRSDYDEYLHVWEGQCKQALTGAVYAKELRKAAAQHRITNVPYEKAKPVDTFWDLGRADSTAIWLAQLVGQEYRVLEYIEDSQEDIDHYLMALQTRRYLWGTDYLPHDAKAKRLGMKRTIQEQLRDAGRTVRIVHNHRIADGINAARTIFPKCWFDKEKCAEGLNALRHYRYEVDEETGQFSDKPLHDWASHGADAFRYLAMAMREPRGKPKIRLPQALSHLGDKLGGQGWLQGFWAQELAKALEVVS